MQQEGGSWSLMIRQSVILMKSEQMQGQILKRAGKKKKKKEEVDSTKTLDGSLELLEQLALCN